MRRSALGNEQTGASWDDQAATYDDEPDHGLRDPAVRSAWQALLQPLLPPAPARVADLGCGTGSLAVLLAAMGHEVTGLDTSQPMIRAARAKAAAAKVSAQFGWGDAASPPLPVGSIDVILVRHVLWALPDRDAAVRSWTTLLAPEGRLILVEGFWRTGGGLHCDDCLETVRRHRSEAVAKHLTNPALWGGQITDERYLISSRA